MPSKRRFSRSLNCYMPAKVIAVVEKAADAENVTVSEVVRDLLSAGIEARGLA